MFTIDLAEELREAGITSYALHPATYMPTKIVATPTSTLEEGVAATVRLVVDPAPGPSGAFFDGVAAARAEEQAYDAEARRKLRDLSRRLSGA
jgi:hypothetical protein